MFRSILIDRIFENLDKTISASKVLIENIDACYNAPPVFQDLREAATGIVYGPLNTRLESARAALQNRTLESGEYDLITNITGIGQLVEGAHNLVDAYTNSRIKYFFSGGGWMLKIIIKQFGEADAAMDKILNPALLLSPSQFKVADGECGVAVPHSEAVLVEAVMEGGYVPGVSGPGSFILEGMRYTPGEQGEVAGKVRDLANRLYRVKLSPGIPRIVGYRHSPLRESYEVVFEIPAQNGPPRSLQDLLADKGPIPSMESRWRVCIQLIQALVFTHKVGIVHKNIRPRNLLVLPRTAEDQNKTNEYYIPRDSTTADLGAFLLTNWSGSMEETYDPSLEGGNGWIYQHPHLKRGQPEYIISYDIYSAGVCMLELMLWKSIEACLAEVTIEGSAEELAKDPDVIQKVLFCMADKMNIGHHAGRLVMRCLRVLGGDGFELDPMELHREQMRDLLGERVEDDILKRQEKEVEDLREALRSWVLLEE